jgi:hypothetical protein
MHTSGQASSDGFVCDDVGTRDESKSIADHATVSGQPLTAVGGLICGWRVRTRRTTA